MENTVSRRGFVAGAAFGSAVLGTIALTSAAHADETDEAPATETASNAESTEGWLGEAPEISADEIVNTLETETLIVGAGCSGLVAGMAAAERGMDFILCESLSTYGGSHNDIGAMGSRFQEEGGLEVDKGRWLNEWARYASFKNDQTVGRVWTDYSGEFVEWLADTYKAHSGVESTVTVDVENGGDGRAGGTIYYIPPECHHISNDGFKDEEGKNLRHTAIMAQIIEEDGYEIKYEHELVELIREENGPVTGAIFTTPDGYVQINAKNTLLTTGGYAGNYEMLEALNPLLVRNTTSTDGWTLNTGMGIKAAMWAGAQRDVEPTGMIWDRGLTEPGTPCGFVRDEETGGWKFPHTGQFNPSSQPFLRVNAEGERFMNESGPYDWSVNCSSQQTNGTWHTVWDANFCDDVVKFDKLGCASLTIIMRDMYMEEGGTFDQMAEEGTLVKADTLEELAEGLNIPVDAFLATVERYNEIAESGVDEDFGKEDYRLSTLTTPPFYGITTGGCILTTGDGIKINKDMQVIDRANKVIEGLYAAGDCSGSFFSGVYPELYPGLACGRTMTEARHAVRFIMGA